jgi:hypothetical protein
MLSTIHRRFITAYLDGELESKAIRRGLRRKEESIDNDQPPLNGATPHQFFFGFILLNPACLGPVNGPPITSGNIAVHDAS